MQKLIIAIDGYSSSGKSTLAKLLAKKLGFIHIDSGAMYRAITLFAMHHKFIDGRNVLINNLLDALPDIDIRFKKNDDTHENETWLNGENVEKEIREMEVSSKVSLIAKIPEVRIFAVDLQRKMGEEKGIVMDGRDIGTVVFPHADLKIFLNASVEERAERRYQELQKKGNKVSFEEVLENLKERDEIDTTREVSPLRQAEDAILIDNGNLSVEQTIEKVMEIVQKTQS